MNILKDKKIIIAVSGSIAAYKTAHLVRLLIKNHAEVQVIMTDSAKDFITPLTLSTLSKRPVVSSFVNHESGTWNNHVDLGLWADAMVIAPATAKTISKCAHGYCDDLLAATYLSAKCPVFFAPAMDLDMYIHGSTKQNMQTLTNYGNQIIHSEFGELASGLIGDGRMAEPETIVATLIRHFSKSDVVTGKKVLITAGPTTEDIDPVRYISNRSSGKMGYAIAKAFAEAGAQVTIVSGPTNIKVDDPNIQVIQVNTAKQMLEQTAHYYAQNELIIYAAAVADYTPAQVAVQKIKKAGQELNIELTKTIDIAATLGKEKQAHQIAIGFALETEKELDHALDKLKRKNFDYIILNSLNDAGAGFAHDTNKITVINKKGEITPYPLKSKDAVAYDILDVMKMHWTSQKSIN
jgi:phosphopantothenoylcysteine decarboxylase/phosphopantothenate--cysteine ligase